MKHTTRAWSERLTFDCLLRDLVYVEGQLRYSDYTDKEGVQRTKADVYQCKLSSLL